MILQNVAILASHHNKLPGVMILVIASSVFIGLIFYSYWKNKIRKSKITWNPEDYEA